MATHTIVSCALLLTTLSAATAGAQTPAAAATPCGGQVYRGFDSRLTGELLARIPEATSEFVGLEVDGAQPFVAAGHAVYTIDAGRVAVTRFPEAIRSIATDRQGDLLVQTTRTIHVLPRAPGKPFSVPSDQVTGRIVGSGADSFLEVRSDADTRARLIAHRPADFAALPVVTLQGPHGPIAWTPLGMTAVLDAGVMVMSAKDERLRGIDRDRTFADATDIAQLPDGRTIVAMKNLVLMTDDDSRIALAAIDAAVRPSGSSLIVFERRHGYLWRVSGLEKIGAAADNRRHANDLLSQWKTSGDVQSGLEAARILGCRALSRDGR